MPGCGEIYLWGTAVKTVGTGTAFRFEEDDDQFIMGYILGYQAVDIFIFVALDSLFSEVVTGMAGSCRSGGGIHNNSAAAQALEGQAGGRMKEG
jgi:hypothetical protein